ncbi:GL23857 [Drosophila persimilis]|uniref:GL23857 n=1 Tax=Drosophila persimilis TaxID=7234 RepID=B4G5Y8_DROPE|nr:glycine-rich RNA-binding protein 10 [Drosophila persimilis]EDW23920.1 GL23857 [Drosophila persimilis]
MGQATAFVVLALCALAVTEAAVYIGGGCYDCNPPGGQGPGIYTGGGRGGGGAPNNYYNQGGGRGGGGGSGRPVYSGNFGPNGYSGGGGGRGGGGGYRNGGGGGGYDDGGLTQIIRYD